MHECLLWRRQTRPPAHDRKPVGVRALCRGPGRARGKAAPDPVALFCQASVHNSRIMQRNLGVDSVGLFLCIKHRHKSGMIYGYARVSTDGQSVKAQVRQLAKAGCSKVFREVASGAKTDRAQLRKALDRLDAGDVLMVTRLDRLARSTRDLLNTLAAIVGKKAGFRSVGDA